MKRASVTLLSLLVILVEWSTAADQGCYYVQKLRDGETYYVKNPTYPNWYVGRQSCTWIARSDHRVRLTCNDFRMPWSNNCTFDNLAVRVSETVTHRYCGDGTFTAESQGNVMTITLTAPFWSPGGRFLCELRAIEKDSGVEDCQCGRKNPSKIVGGVNTGVNEFPMMAALVDSVIRDAFCGGTIISERYVLTAAHCLVRRNVQTLAVLVGDHDLSTGLDTNASVLHRVSEIHSHPDYNESVQDNDIGVVRTVQPIEFNNQVGPACLPFQHAFDSFGGSYVILLGWGTTEFGGSKSDVLQQVTVSVLGNVACSYVYPTVGPRQICTTGDGKDACQFDSGGPVLWQNPTSQQMVHVGIISYGGVCGMGPAVNTRVGLFIDWILSVTRGATYCKSE